MTVIAWDGKTLAADRRATQSGLAYAVTKIERCSGALIGYTGDACNGLALKQWWKDGCVPTEFPDSCKTAYDQTLIVITAIGEILVYTCSPFPLQIEQQFHAWGSGRDFAIAAMHYGETAVEAVKCAIQYQSDCGNGIDTLTLEPST